MPADSATDKPPRPALAANSPSRTRRAFFRPRAFFWRKISPPEASRPEGGANSRFQFAQIGSMSPRVRAAWNSALQAANPPSAIAARIPAMIC